MSAGLRGVYPPPRRALGGGGRHVSRSSRRVSAPSPCSVGAPAWKTDRSSVPEADRWCQEMQDGSAPGDGMCPRPAVSLSPTVSPSALLLRLRLRPAPSPSSSPPVSAACPAAFTASTVPTLKFLTDAIPVGPSSPSLPPLGPRK